MSQLPHSVAPLCRPASPCAEDPSHISPGLFERREMIVERGDETEVVQHGRDIEKLGVVRDPSLSAPRLADHRYERTQWLTSAAEL